MLSYRHAFHAGNHADVLKHFVLVDLLRYLGQKDKPYWYIDTHAGAGKYGLEDAVANKLAEYKTGIATCLGQEDTPPAVQPYIDAIASLNGGSKLRFYPGSPWLAMHFAREQDRLRLFELHPTDFPILARHFEKYGRQAQVVRTDGFAALKALLPPPSRRALVLIDPSYETRADYAQIISVVKDGLARFPSCTFAIWYPCLSRIEAKELPGRLKKLAPCWLNVALQVCAPSNDGFGMFGSGMFIINPPWTLNTTLQEVMPWLQAKLGQDERAGFVLEYEDGETAKKAAPAVDPDELVLQSRKTKKRGATK